jgi:hypothetical protein
MADTAAWPLWQLGRDDGLADTGELQRFVDTAAWPINIIIRIIIIIIIIIINHQSSSGDGVAGVADMVAWQLRQVGRGDGNVTETTALPIRHQ